MELIALYLCAAIAASITSYLWYFRPALLDALAGGVENEFTSSPKLSATIYMVLSTVLAPVILAILLIPSASDTFEKSIYNLVQN